jgi:hypothetical protein
LQHSRVAAMACSCGTCRRRHSRCTKWGAPTEIRCLRKWRMSSSSVRLKREPDGGARGEAGPGGRRRCSPRGAAAVVSMGGGGRRFSRRASLEARTCCPRSSSEHRSEHVRADYGAPPRHRSCSWFVAPPHRRRCFFSRGIGDGGARGSRRR